MAPDIHRLIGQDEEAAQRFYNLYNDNSDKNERSHHTLRTTFDYGLTDTFLLLHIFKINRKLFTFSLIK